MVASYQCATYIKNHSKYIKYMIKNKLKLLTCRLYLKTNSYEKDSFDYTNPNSINHDLLEF